MPAALDLVETIRSLPLELRRDYHSLTRSGKQRVSRRSGDALRPLDTAARPAQAAAIFAAAIATYRANVAHEAARHGLPNLIAPSTSPHRDATPDASPAPPNLPPARYYLPCACGSYLSAKSPRARVPSCTHGEEFAR
ncbi:hypothetical protein [Microbacterium testaceum]|uniref:hypothetical protein n=1 Tax=Microbacterium testaceum TaxID=2033 RepID=UPI002434D25E|nr:hypothetical protein [Microbacterium testaceum]